MPCTAGLIAGEGYAVQRYRCGLPSSTPACQAGIMYGDNSEIPSFRWYDKEARVTVGFVLGATFDQVRHKYFQDRAGLVDGGATINACFSGGAAQTFMLAYRRRVDRRDNVAITLDFLRHLKYSLPWIGMGVRASWRHNRAYWLARLRGQPAEKLFVLTGLFEEVFLHHLTRYAMLHAMDQDFPVIYGCQYAYDEAAHAFGPGHDFALEILRQVDHTVRAIADRRRDRYELLILSDHGQTPMTYIRQAFGATLGQWLGQQFPAIAVEENFSGHHTVYNSEAAAKVLLTYCGGLADLYALNTTRRLSFLEIDQQFPGLVARLSNHPGVEFILLRDAGRTLVVRRGERFHLHAGDGRTDYWRKFDDPRLVRAQLERLNGYERSGDVILFGAFDGRRQVNFEPQVGSHGSLGGEQSFPFVLARSAWGLDLGAVRSSNDLYPLFRKLRDDLRAGRY